MCLMPIKAFIPPEGGRAVLNPEGDLPLPCGKCSECISARALEWAQRAKYEISQHDNSCFITLTYDDDHLESNEIIVEHIQKFIKRLRKRLGSKKIKYMYSCEYGTKTYRPHFHILIIGYIPRNMKHVRTTLKGSKLYTSPDIEKLWDKGYHSIGEANEKTAYYIAAYALKGRTNTLVTNGGEIRTFKDFMRTSQGFGLNYLRANSQQLVDSGQILPRYFLKKLKELHPNLLSCYENSRLEKIKTRSDHELYAKFIIDQQKKQEQSEFRSSAPDQFNDYLERHLQHQRDDFHLLTTKEEDYEKTIMLNSRH